jgi:2-polyprenyl-3-methyl-5-hydroxy-6-metoxy-1,4-benzoquinol methylase
MTMANELSPTAANLFREIHGCPNLEAIVRAVLAVWPEHEGYCLARFADNAGDFKARANTLAGTVLAIVGDELPLYATDYRWMCEEFINEELHFRRNGAYRLSTFAEANAEVYSNGKYMERYVRGILISQIIWKPHAQAFDFFQTHFLPSLPQASSYLEVGPGHGMFLYMAATAERIAKVEAWDVSESSILETKSTLRRMGLKRDVNIVLQDVLKAPTRTGEFDGAIISEVLEHLERPDLALASLRAALKPGGRIFINAPVNSPAPDHIYLWRSTDEFRQFVIDQGLEIEEFEEFPVTGATLDKAKRHKLSISCVVIARKPGA